MAEHIGACAECGAMMTEGATFCGLCGAPVGVATAEPDLVKTPIEPENRTREELEYERQKAELLARMGGSRAARPERTPAVKTKNKRQDIMIAIGAAVLLIVCLGTFTGIVSLKYYRLNTQDKPVMAKVMDQEMRALVARDTETALGYFAANSYKTITELDSFLKESN